MSYKVEKVGILMKQSQYDTLTHGDLSAAISIPSPSGGVYMVYNRAGRALRRYTSAFYVHTTQAVLTVDRVRIEQKLVQYWTAARTG